MNDDAPRRLPSGTNTQGSLGSMKEESLIGGSLDLASLSFDDSTPKLAIGRD